VWRRAMLRKSAHRFGTGIEEIQMVNADR